jgi:1-acyl-sn-glycerol-3-phosphate acyltransferase
LKAPGGTPGRPASSFTRRARSVPLYLILLALSVALAPVAFPLAIAFDVATRRRLAATRGLAATVVYLACEVVGLGVAGLLWAWPSRRRYADANYALQRAWAGTLFHALCRLYGMTLELDGEEALSQGPILFFVRHSSTADTLLPVVLFARAGLHPRYVLKRELLWDPCLDVVGNRVPNAFVRRDGGDPDAVGAVAALATGLTRDDGIVIYPEGTRATAGARARAVARLEGSPRLAGARALRHLLPPRVGGPLALVSAATGVDVVFAAHVGLEGAATLGDLTNGRLIGARVRVKLFRVPASEIPAEGREAWLDAWWSRLDAWVTAESDPERGRGSGDRDAG